MSFPELNVLCVGESRQTLRKRMNQHRSEVKFENNSNKLQYVRMSFQFLFISDTYLVYCEFNDQGNALLVSSFFYYNDVDYFSSFYGSSDKLETVLEKVYSFPEDMIKSVMKKDNHQCSQNVKLTCYYHDVISDNSKRYTESIVIVVEACNNRQVKKLYLILTNNVPSFS